MYAGNAETAIVVMVMTRNLQIEIHSYRTSSSCLLQDLSILKTPQLRHNEVVALDNPVPDFTVWR